MDLGENPINDVTRPGVKLSRQGNKSSILKMNGKGSDGNSGGTLTVTSGQTVPTSAVAASSKHGAVQTQSGAGAEMEETQDDDRNAERRTSRRVSFANTCQVKEFLHDPTSVWKLETNKDALWTSQARELTQSNHAEGAVDDQSAGQSVGGKATDAGQTCTDLGNLLTDQIQYLPLQAVNSSSEDSHTISTTGMITDAMEITLNRTVRSDVPSTPVGLKTIHFANTEDNMEMTCATDVVVESDETSDPIEPQTTPKVNVMDVLKTMCPRAAVSTDFDDDLLEISQQIDTIVLKSSSDVGVDATLDLGNVSLNFTNLAVCSTSNKFFKNGDDAIHGSKTSNDTRRALKRPSMGASPSEHEPEVSDQRSLDEAASKLTFNQPEFSIQTRKEKQKQHSISRSRVKNVHLSNVTVQRTKSTLDKTVHQHPDAANVDPLDFEPLMKNPKLAAIQTGKKLISTQARVTPLRAENDSVDYAALSVNKPDFSFLNVDVASSFTKAREEKQQPSSVPRSRTENALSNVTVVQMTSSILKPTLDDKTDSNVEPVDFLMTNLKLAELQIDKKQVSQMLVTSLQAEKDSLGHAASSMNLPDISIQDENVASSVKTREAQQQQPRTRTQNALSNATFQRITSNTFKPTLDQMPPDTNVELNLQPFKTPKLAEFQTEATEISQTLATLVRAEDSSCERHSQPSATSYRRIDDQEMNRRSIKQSNNSIDAVNSTQKSIKNPTEAPIHDVDKSIQALAAHKMVLVDKSTLETSHSVQEPAKILKFAQIQNENIQNLETSTTHAEKPSSSKLVAALSGTLELPLVHKSIEVNEIVIQESMPTLETPLLKKKSQLNEDKIGQKHTNIDKEKNKIVQQQQILKLAESDKIKLGKQVSSIFHSQEAATKPSTLASTCTAKRWPELLTEESIDGVSFPEISLMDTSTANDEISSSLEAIEIRNEPSMVAAKTIKTQPEKQVVVQEKFNFDQQKQELLKLMYGTSSLPYSCPPAAEGDDFSRHDRIIYGLETQQLIGLADCFFCELESVCETLDCLIAEIPTDEECAEVERLNAAIEAKEIELNARKEQLKAAQNDKKTVKARCEDLKVLVHESEVQKAAALEEQRNIESVPSLEYFLEYVLHEWSQSQIHVSFLGSQVHYLFSMDPLLSSSSYDDPSSVATGTVRKITRWIGESVCDDYEVVKPLAAFAFNYMLRSHDEDEVFARCSAASTDPYAVKKALLAMAFTSVHARMLLSDLNHIKLSNMVTILQDSVTVEFTKCDLIDFKLTFVVAPRTYPDEPIPFTFKSLCGDVTEKRVFEMIANVKLGVCYLKRLVTEVNRVILGVTYPQVEPH